MLEARGDELLSVDGRMVLLPLAQVVDSLILHCFRGKNRG